MNYYLEGENCYLCAIVLPDCLTCGVLSGLYRICYTCFNGSYVAGGYGATYGFACTLCNQMGCATCNNTSCCMACLSNFYMANGVWKIVPLKQLKNKVYINFYFIENIKIRVKLEKMKLRIHY
jgi:hypothetical protein